MKRLLTLSLLLAFFALPTYALTSTTVSLPAAASGTVKMYSIPGGSDYVYALTPDGSDTIENSVTVRYIVPGEYIWLIGTGSNWVIGSTNNPVLLKESVNAQVFTQGITSQANIDVDDGDGDSPFMRFIDGTGDTTTTMHQDEANNWFEVNAGGDAVNFGDDSLTTTGALNSGNFDTSGTIQAGSGNHTLTNATGLLDLEKGQDDSMDEDVPDWGTGYANTTTDAVNVADLGITAGTMTVDPSSLADGAGETVSIDLTSDTTPTMSAALGDIVFVTAPYDLQDIMVTAYVQAADTVEIRIQNESGAGPTDLASGTWNLVVWSKD